MILGQMDRHIGRIVLLAMLAVTSVGALLSFIFGIIDESSAGESGISLLVAAKEVALNLPMQMQDVMPLSIFLGALIGLGTLSASSELTIYRAAGISGMRLFLCAAMPGLLLLSLSITIVEALVVSGTTDSHEANYRRLSNDWLRDGTSFMRIGSMTSDGVLLDIARYELGSEGQLDKVIEAESAEFDDARGVWILHGVDHLEVDPIRSDRAQIEAMDWNSDFSPQSLLSVLTNDPDKMGLFDLYSQIDHLKASQGNPVRYQIEFWSKMLKPLAILGLILVATAFALGLTREMGMGSRIVVGMMVGFVFHYTQELIAPLSIVYEIHPLIVISTPLILIWSFGLIMVRRSS